MKTHLLPKIISAALLLGMATVANAARNHSAAQAQQIASFSSVEQQVQAIVQASGNNSSGAAYLTVEVITFSGKNIKNAAGIAGGVVSANPNIRPSTLAAAIGRQFPNHPQLAAESPQIAAAMVMAILSRGSSGDHIAEAAATVAALTSQLPGTVQGNHATIVAIGKAVAAAVLQTGGSSEAAATIVGTTATALKSSAGRTNIKEVMAGFADQFKTGDTALGKKLDSIVANVNAGQTFNALPQNPASVQSGVNTGYSTGSLVTPETPKVNQ